MNDHQIPGTLRDTIQRGLDPVRPLLSPGVRACLVAALAGVVAAAALTLGSTRFDLAALPVWLSWGSFCLELALGLALIALALREAVPGGMVPAGAAWSMLAAGVGTQILVAVSTWLHSSGAPVGDWAAAGMRCFGHDSLLALPAFAVTLWLVFRALPLRAPMAGLLGGGGAALTADAAFHLLCPISDLHHVLVWHTGVILGFMALGWASGSLWGHRRWRRGAG